MASTEVDEACRERNLQDDLPSMQKNGNAQPKRSRSPVLLSWKSRSLTPMAVLLLLGLMLSIDTGVSGFSNPQSKSLGKPATSLLTCAGRRFSNQLHGRGEALWLVREPKIATSWSPDADSNRNPKEISSMLAKKESDYDRHPSKNQRPELQDYFNLMQAWSRTRQLSKTVALLERIEAFQDTIGYQHISPGPEQYLHVIEALGKRSRLTPRDYQTTESWLHRMLDRRRKDMTSGADVNWDGRLVAKAIHVCIEACGSVDTHHNWGAAQDHAVRLLRKLQQLESPDIYPTTYTFCAVMKVLARVGGYRVKSTAFALIEEMEYLYENDKVGPVQPNSFAYSTLIHTISKSGGGTQGAIEAERVLTKMVDLYESGANRECKPNAYTYDGVILSWARSNGGVEAAKRAEAILDHMQKLYLAGNRDLRPLTFVVNSVLDAWSRSNSGRNSILAVEETLRRMQGATGTKRSIKALDVWPNTESIEIATRAWKNNQIPDSSGVEGVLRYVAEINQRAPQARRLSLSATVYHTLIATYSQSKRNPDARKAEALLYRWINDKTVNSTPGSKPFSHVITAWSKSREEQGPERAEQLLNEMIKLWKGGAEGARPNVIVYTAVIDAWAKSGRPEAMQRALALFDRMQYEHDIMPNTITYNALLWCLTCSDDPKAVEIAPRILEQMKEAERRNDSVVVVTSRAVSSFMACLARQSGRDSKFAEQADAVLESMVSECKAGNNRLAPNSYSFNAVINAWVACDSPRSTSRILETIDQAQELYFTGVTPCKPHAICFNNAMRYFTDKGDVVNMLRLLDQMELCVEKGAHEAAPDLRTYAAVLHLLAQQNTKVSNLFDKAMGLLRRMKAQVQIGNTRARPTATIYGMIIGTLAMSKVDKRGSRALELLDEMKRLAAAGDKDVKPNTVTYSSVINVLAKSEEDGIAFTALTLLAEMESLRREGDSSVVPNLICFNAVLNALAKEKTREAALRAEQLLDRMTELSQKDPAYTDSRPDVVSFASAISAWASARAPESAERAEALISRMERLANEGQTDAAPDWLAYNKAILACTTIKSVNGMARAEKILQRMEEMSEKPGSSVQPDGFSYRSVLLGWATVGNTERAQELLHFLEAEYAKGRQGFKPDGNCYKAVDAALQAKGPQVRKKGQKRRVVAKSKETESSEEDDTT